MKRRSPVAGGSSRCPKADNDEKSTGDAGIAAEKAGASLPHNGKIAMAVTYCLECFHAVLVILKHDNSTSEAAFRTFRDEETRFKVWSGNIGAHKTGRSSLDYRLRDASHLQKQVSRLLEDLWGLLTDARAILEGDKVPWDKLDDGPLREGDMSESECAETELDQISTDVIDVVNCLLRLSVSIRNPAPHDRFRGSASTETDYYVPFDIQHVQSKFGSTAGNYLAERLGKAISRRRQYFRYRENHHAKLMQGLDPDQKDDLESTIASSIPHHMNDPGATTSTQVVDEDARSDTGVSETSFASSAAGTARLRLPPLPKESHNGPFECPFCFMIIAATNTTSWKRHVYGDLRPYVCLSDDCETPDQEFVRRRDWMQHEVENHWKTYSCPLGCPEESSKFSSARSLKIHLTSNHKSQVSASQLEALIDLSARPIRIENGVTCRLCGEVLFSVRTYRRHVGRHQEQISLFALPNIAQAGDDGGTDDNESTEDDGDSDGEGDVKALSNIAMTASLQDEEDVISVNDEFGGSDRLPLLNTGSEYPGPFHDPDSRKPRKLSRDNDSDINSLSPMTPRPPPIPSKMDVDDEIMVGLNYEDDSSSGNGRPPHPAILQADALPNSDYKSTTPTDLARYGLDLDASPRSDYEYTAPGDLARYDLDSLSRRERQSRPGNGAMRRQMSMEEITTRGRSPPRPFEETSRHGWRISRPRAPRPAPNTYDYDRTGGSIIPGLPRTSRNRRPVAYDVSGTDRPAIVLIQDSRSARRYHGPPPTTRGLDKINAHASAPSEYDESPAPSPYVSHTTTDARILGERRTNRNRRTSVYDDVSITGSPTAVHVVIQDSRNTYPHHGQPSTTRALDSINARGSAPSEPNRTSVIVTEPGVLDVDAQDPNSEQPAVRGILKEPTPLFPEEPNPIREGVAPHKDDKSKLAGVPAGAKWTKISRMMVNPEALTIGKERFEVRDDFVIVLRVLSKEEIQAYADATAELRERRRQEYLKEVEEAQVRPYENPDTAEESHKERPQIVRSGSAIGGSKGDNENRSGGGRGSLKKRRFFGAGGGSGS